MDAYQILIDVTKILLVGFILRSLWDSRPKGG